MNERCPACQLEFSREPGYFTGAMYISYTLAALLLGLLFLVLWGLIGWPMEWALGTASLILLLFVPLIFRHSRVVWMYLDRPVDPDF